ncbi:hypothetical protein [Ochrobactrum sp. S1502_03]|uniref:hypothetical protein n=1 Tax=Ochrobactrum sp. S1502_03 TaxID=3108451 RepID=UPI0037C75583
MPNTLKNYNLLTLTQAARLAGRSYSWARDCSISGKLETKRFGGKGRLFVTAESLKALLMAENKAFPVRNKQTKSYLRLVVDNTK